MIIVTAEDMWRNSRECAIARALTEDGSYDQYCVERDLYKAKRIFDLYGYEWFRRFIDRCPHIVHLLDDYVPCKQSPDQYQCTMFCHKYNFEKGCTLNATE